jgi:hypothetical protein
MTLNQLLISPQDRGRVNKYKNLYFETNVQANVSCISKQMIYDVSGMALQDSVSELMNPCL